jgi:hypothetical protein
LVTSFKGKSEFTPIIGDVIQGKSEFIPIIGDVTQG